MTVIRYTKQFRKNYEKLPTKKQQKVRGAIALFLNNPRDPSLRLHELRGELSGVWSLSADGDLRVHFRYYDDTIVLFLTVGSHSQLY